MNDSDEPHRQFTNRVNDMVMSALRDQLSATFVTSVLLRASFAIAVGFKLDLDELMIRIVAEMNDDQEGHLH